MVCRNVSGLGSQSGVSENALSSDADENIEQLHLLAETVDKRKAQNRIAQRKHRQKLKKRIEELESQLEHVNATSLPIVHRMQPHSTIMAPASAANAIEDDIAPQIGHIDFPFAESNGQLETIWGSQEQNLPFSVLPPCSHIATSYQNGIPLSAAEIQPLQFQNLADVGHSTTIPTPSTISLTATTRMTGDRETPAATSINRRSSLHRLSDLPDLDDPNDPARSWRMERKIAYLVDCAKALGFRDFDAAVMAYYTSSFDIMSQAHDMQNVSRSRGLGSALRAINTSAETWSEHQGHVYRVEVFKAAEHLYRTELQKAIDRGALRALEKHVQEDVTMRSHKSELLSQIPNLWTFLLELSECDPPTSFEGLLYHYLSYQKATIVDKAL
ncbi:hypothetical protein DER45DRAFT_632329 [Fusarium avenaceum]|nr:hypothetical protein DER45DRAFT_632329 [Fusarium avenaceum]